ncbi:hypothetical protein C5167_033351 [Papaver somniferum]|uniref:Clp ATPase C-terminal domain-containing protein n=1 Tax=Papaver somniferum TaxID=3469 RepID=A0A4Y7KCQ1_PAPSO|nr:hypothetical protein C5167_033351 [Papaver somniferum]
MGNAQCRQQEREGDARGEKALQGPELLNRLNKIVVGDQLRKVGRFQMRDRRIALAVSDAALDLDVVLTEIYILVYGARPIRRWLEKW